MSNGKDNSFNSWIDKTRMKCVIFQTHVAIVKTKAEFGVYNYTTIFDFTIETAVDTSDFAKKADLASINQILIN